MAAENTTATDSRRVLPAVHPDGPVYLIFAFESGGEGDAVTWREVGRRAARDAKTATRELVKTLPANEQDNMFAATPERSWTKLLITPRVVTEYDVKEVDYP